MISVNHTAGHPQTSGAHRPMTRTHRTHEAGQALVIMAIAMVAVIAGIGLIIDGGNAWAQQRISQNGNDASAEAGAAVVLANYAVQADAGRAAGTRGRRGRCSTARPIGTGSRRDRLLHRHLRDAPAPRRHARRRARPTPRRRRRRQAACPRTTTRTPTARAASSARSPASRSSASKDVRDRSSRAWSASATLNANTTATAVSGLLQGTAVRRTGCIVLPVTAPVTVVTCDGNGNSPISTSTYWPKDTRIVVPLCKNGPGNVGWLDWTPKGGGTPELIETRSCTRTTRPSTCRPGST